MKYLPVRELENVTSALNFDTLDCHVMGGCDLYITKSIGSDKKLYKAVETSLESQHDALERFASLSPPNAGMVDLTRSSPFGPLTQVSSRRTFAYLIATLNSSHPDYEFANSCRPTDFRREKTLKSIMNTIDETLYNLRPRVPSTLSAANAIGLQTPGGSQTWGPKMWNAIDREMTLKECDIYVYSPEDDPFDGEESAIWSLHYFFFNKNRKRVCYIYARGMSIANHATNHIRSKRSRPISQTLSMSDAGASKRAKYWLGDQAEHLVGSWNAGPCSDTIPQPGDDQVDAEDALGDSDISRGVLSDDEDEYDEDELEARFRGKSKVMGMNDHIAAMMDEI